MTAASPDRTSLLVKTSLVKTPFLFFLSSRDGTLKAAMIRLTQLFVDKLGRKSMPYYPVCRSPMWD